MPTSFSCACTSCVIFASSGVFDAFRTILKPFGCPPSASFALAAFVSRLTTGTAPSYAQLLGGTGPFAIAPIPKYATASSSSRSTASDIASLSALVASGPFATFSQNPEYPTPGPSR